MDFSSLPKVITKLKIYSRDAMAKSVTKCRGSWVVGRGRGSWVWVNVVGKNKIIVAKFTKKISII